MSNFILYYEVVLVSSTTYSSGKIVTEMPTTLIPYTGMQDAKQLARVCGNAVHNSYAVPIATHPMGSVRA
jgi:hypothetical protein